MILTVTLNAAMDDTYEVPEPIHAGLNRVSAVHRRPGGKGVNVARVLHALGHEVLATGLAGGPTGQTFRDSLAGLGIPADFISIHSETRRTVTVVGPAKASPAGQPRISQPANPADSASEPPDVSTTMFTEPGPMVTAAEWANFVGRYEPSAREAQAVVLSGSLPPGVPQEAYADLTRRTTAPVILDADGAALRHGAAGRPAIAKPNVEELANATGTADPGKGAHALRAAGAETVVASLGPDGVLAVTPDGTFRATLDRALPGNATGAGDALVAGLAIGLLEGRPWPERLAYSVALSASAVRSPVAGEIDAAGLAGLLARVRVTAKL